MDASTIVEPRSIEVDAAAVVFAALGEPLRLRILDVLADAARCVCDIREQVPLAPNLLSYHLRVLREAGLVETTQRGRFLDYRLADDAATAVAVALHAAGFNAVVDQPPGCTTECGPSRSNGAERGTRR